jgi:hypothetical protein
MSVPDRIYQIAKAYLDAARGRLDEIDDRAQAELERALGPGGSVVSPAIDDPMARAAAKIAAARGEAAARSTMNAARSQNSQPERYNFSTPDPSHDTFDTDPIQTAYRVIGVPLGSDIATVDRAVAKLRERAAPEKFAEGSAEKDDAVRIQARIDNAYAVLQDALGVQGNRFDRLEL